MTQLPESSLKSNKRKGLPRSLMIDMIPMVDLGFLLITFFIFTTTMSESRAGTMVIPSDGAGGNTGESATVSVLLGGGNQVFFYYGKWETAVANKAVFKINYNVYTGLGKWLRLHQKWISMWPAKKNPWYY